MLCVEDLKSSARFISPLNMSLLNVSLSAAVLSSSPGHGFGSSKMSRAQTFPSYATEQNEEAQAPLSRSSSYGFSYSSSLIQWHTEATTDKKDSLSWTCHGVIMPPASGKTNCSTNWQGSGLARSNWKVKNWSSASLIQWLSPLFIEFLWENICFTKQK